jgi:two-component system, response regulator PdtaR
MSNIRFAIVEDEPIIAEDIGYTLTQLDFDVCGIAYNYNKAIELIQKTKPDFALLDINLNGGQEGIEIANWLNKNYRIPFIYLTSYSDKNTLEQAKTTEPGGYIVKPFTQNALYASIEIALYNNSQRTKSQYPELNLETINHKISQPLTVREFEVLQLIYEGNTNNQIADKIFVSINTIKKHINNAYLKLDETNRTAVLAKLRGLMASN